MLSSATRTRLEVPSYSNGVSKTMVVQAPEVMVTEPLKTLSDAATVIQSVLLLKDDLFVALR